MASALKPFSVDGGKEGRREGRREGGSFSEGSVLSFQ